MNTMHLIGAEQVERASGQMTRAADDMQKAASSMAFALEQHQRFLDDWLQRLEGTLEELTRKEPK